jgi:hypothetical protein
MATAKRVDETMSGYGTGTDVETLLEAMRDKVKAATSSITYLRNAEIVAAVPLMVPADPAIYLIWTGSPMEKVREGSLYEATHEVNIICTTQTTDPSMASAIVGTDRTVGLSTFTGDVIDYYSNNLLGLSGIRSPGPFLHVPSGGVGIEQIEERDEQFVVYARLEYMAHTTPFEFTRT